jgi:hypothetical protein
VRILRFRSYDGEKIDNITNVVLANARCGGPRPILSILSMGLGPPHRRMREDDVGFSI